MKPLNINAAKRAAASALLTVFCALSSPAAWAQTDEEIAVEAVDQIKANALEVLSILRKDNGSNSAAVRREAEEYAIPYFDFERMTILAVGSPWKKANAAQKKTLTEAFKGMLVRIYSGVMLQFKDSEVTIKDRAVVQNHGRSIIVSSVIAPSAAGALRRPVRVDYTLRKAGDRYMIYNVSVEDQSLVTVYRNQFKEIVDKEGFDGLIEQMRDNKIQTKTPGLDADEAAADSKAGAKEGKPGKEARARSWGAWILAALVG